MKIIHTADWHLGNVFHGHVRIAEHRHFLNWLLDRVVEHRPDALLITGDVFDSSNPSAQSEELLYDFLLRATTAVPGLQVVLTAGNHDSAGRIEAPAALLKTHNVYVRGTIHHTPKGEPDFDHYLLPLSSRGSTEAECVCFALPYLRGGDYPAGMTPEEGLRYYFEQLHKRFRKSGFAGLPVVVAAHFYAAGSDVCSSEHSERLVVGGQDCVEASVVGRNVCYTALGHIHKPQQVGGAPNVFYAGSALPMSFAEISYRHGVQYLDIDSEGAVSVSRLEYSPLRNLLTIPPPHRRATTTAELFDAVSSLPKRAKDDAGTDWPYLEIRVEERQPEPGLMHEVMESLADRAVHFCRMVRVRPEGDGPDGSSDTPSAANETLHSLTPLQLARRYFAARYAGDMPQPLIDRFKQAEEAANKQTYNED